MNIFITATNTDIGKTYTTLKLLKLCAEKGFRVGAFKPIETGVDKVAQDAKLLLNCCQELNKEFRFVTIDDICPIQLLLPAAPYIANSGKKIDFKRVDDCYKKLKEKCDILFIEGAGGLLVPVEENFFIIDFIKYFDAVTLLVTHDELGGINDTLLSLEALNSRELKTFWCVNLRYNREDFEKITLPFYKAKFKKVFILQDDLEKLTKELIYLSP